MRFNHAKNKMRNYSSLIVTINHS